MCELLPIVTVGDDSQNRKLPVGHWTLTIQVDRIVMLIATNIVECAVARIYPDWLGIHGANQVQTTVLKRWKSHQPLLNHTATDAQNLSISNSRFYGKVLQGLYKARKT